MPETPSANARLPFDIDEQIDPTLITAHAGVPLVIELFRRMGAAQVINEAVRIKQRQRGLRPAQLVEALIALWAAGGDRCQDLQTLRTDAALGTLLGYELPAATTLRDFLEGFHVEDPLLWRAGEKTAVPEESTPLAGVRGRDPAGSGRCAAAHAAADRDAGCGCHDSGSPQTHGDHDL